jgi:deoxyadenosine kinase
MIVLSGVIGAGKSSLSSILAEHLGSQAFYEGVESNPILPLYYKNMKRYTFLLNVYLLNKRLEQINKALQSKNSVLDRSIYEDKLFFKMNVDKGTADKTEYETYSSLVDNMLSDIPNQPSKKPELLIYIYVPYDIMLKRIKRRGRDYEQLSSDPTLADYYQRLIEYYKNWFAKYDNSPKLLIDGSKYDFVCNDDDREQVLKIIDNKLKELAM